MFEMFLYFIATGFVFWLTSKPSTEVDRTDEKLNSDKVSSLEEGIKSLEIRSSLPISPALYEVEIPDLSSYYPWVQSRKIAQENFCRLDNSRLRANHSYA